MYILVEIESYIDHHDDDSWGEEKEWQQRFKTLALSEDFEKLFAIQTEKEAYIERCRVAYVEYSDTMHKLGKVGLWMVKDESVADWFHRRNEYFQGYEKSSNDVLQVIVDKTGLPVENIIGGFYKRYQIDSAEVL